MDYGDIMYDQPFNSSLCKKWESAQYKATFAITGAIQGTSPENISQDLGLESLKSRRWFRRLSCMFEIMKNEAIKYLVSLIPNAFKHSTQETIIYQLIIYNCRADCFKYWFFSCTLNDWFSEGLGREKDGNRGKFIGSNLVIFCYKEFEKFAMCKSISQSGVIFIVYSEPCKN